MQWDSYTIFSVISGITLVLVALFAPDGSALQRFWCAVAGAAFIGYGIYVAAQTSGTYTFPGLIFGVPFVFAGKALYAWYQRTQPGAASATPQARSTISSVLDRPPVQQPTSGPAPASVQLPPATQPVAAQPVTAQVMPEGSRTCVRRACSQRGVPVAVESCPECGFRTRSAGTAATAEIPAGER